MSQRKPKGYKLLENHTYQCAFWGQLRSDEKGGHEFVDFLRRRDFVPEIGLIVKWLNKVQCELRCRVSQISGLRSQALSVKHFISQCQCESNKHLGNGAPTYLPI